MGERTKLELGIAGAAATPGLLGDGLLRATPWGLHVLLFAIALVGLAVSLAYRSGVALGGDGRLLAAPLLLFAALFARRDSDTLINGLSLLVALSLAVSRSRSGRLVAGLSDYLLWGSQAGFYACAGPIPLLVRDVSFGELRPAGYGPLLAVLRGLAIAAPLLLLFGALFAAVLPLVETLPQLPERDRRAVEAGLRANRTFPVPTSDWRTYNLSRSQAHEALTAVPGTQARGPRGDG